MLHPRWGFAITAAATAIAVWIFRGALAMMRAQTDADFIYAANRHFGVAASLVHREPFAVEV